MDDRIAVPAVTAARVFDISRRRLHGWKQNNLVVPTVMTGRPGGRSAEVYEFDELVLGRIPDILPTLERNPFVHIRISAQGIHTWYGTET